MRGSKFRRITITHISPKEDAEVRREYGPSAKRQQQIVRMAVEAKEQRALQTQEDLAEILDTDARTVRRDIQVLRKIDKNQSTIENQEKACVGIHDDDIS